MESLAPSKLFFAVRYTAIVESLRRWGLFLIAEDRVTKGKWNSPFGSGLWKSRGVSLYWRCRYGCMKHKPFRAGLALPCVPAFGLLKFLPRSAAVQSWHWWTAASVCVAIPTFYTLNLRVARNCGVAWFVEPFKVCSGPSFHIWQILQLLFLESSACSCIVDRWVGWGMLPFLKLVDMVGGRCYGSDLEDVVGSFVAKPVCCEAWVRVFKAHIRGIDSGHGV